MARVRYCRHGRSRSIERKGAVVSVVGLMLLLWIDSGRVKRFYHS